MVARLLWLEDDKLPAIEAALDDAGYIVDRAYLLSDGDALLAKNTYEIVLMDTLMPVYPGDIAIGYTAQETDKGNRAGQVFYSHHRAEFLRTNTGVLVYSIVGNDEDVKMSFVKLGLHEANILYKVSESNVKDLLQHVERVLGSRTRNTRQ